MTDVATCRVPGCIHPPEMVHDVDTFTGKTQGEIAPMNHGLCRAHAHTMPKDVRAVLAVAKSQLDVDAAYARLDGRTWEPVEPDYRAPWWSAARNRDIP